MRSLIFIALIICCNSSFAQPGDWIKVSIIPSNVVGGNVDRDMDLLIRPTRDDRLFDRLTELVNQISSNEEKIFLSLGGRQLSVTLKKGETQKLISYSPHAIEQNSALRLAWSELFLLLNEITREEFSL